MFLEIVRKSVVVGMRKWRLKSNFFFNGTQRVIMSGNQHSTGQAISAGVLAPLINSVMQRITSI